MRIWDLAIKQPVFMTMILAAAVVLGAVSFTRMPLDLFPDVEFPVIVVSTIYPGAGPEEMDQQVTRVLEEELSAISGIDAVSARSSEGISTLILQFQLDVSVDSVSQEVRERVSLLRRQLPDGVEEPIIRRFNPSDNPIMRFGVADSSGIYDPIVLRELVENEIQIPLQRVAGVAAIEVDGGLTREIKVNLDLQAMQARRITPQQVLDALRAQNLNLPAGSIVEQEREMLVRTPGNYQTLDDIRNTIIVQREAPVYLRDIAQVEDSFETRDVITRLNGEESIVVSVRKQSGTNTAAVSAGVKSALAPIAAANPALNIVIAGDEAVVVNESAMGAIEDLIWGALLATLVIFFFFRNVRNTLITMAGLPVIMIASLFFLDMLGISLNQLSLLALALVVGLVIDDAIVVRENIMRWIDKGYSPRVAASKGTAEVVLPVIATSATILAVFLPVAYAEGIIGRFFRDFGLTVSVAIIVSTFEALTLAPMLSSIFFKPKQDTDPSAPAMPEPDENVTEIPEEAHEPTGLLDRVYGHMINWTLRFKALAALVAAGVIAASVISFQYIEQSFLPSLDRGQFDVSMELPVGTPLAVTAREASQVEAILLSHPLITDVFTTVGGNRSNRATFFVKVEGDGNGELPTRVVIDQLRNPLRDVPGISFQLADNPTGGDVILGGKDIIIQVQSSTGDYGILGQEAARFAAAMGQIPGVVDVDVSFRPGTPELQVQVDRQRAGDVGLSAAQIASTVRTLVNGETATVFRGEGSEANIRVQVREGDMTRAQDILGFNLLTPTGQQIPISSVARGEVVSGPNEIVRSERLLTVSIGANVSGRGVPATTDEVTALVESFQFAPGIVGGLGGDAEAQSDSFRSLGLAMALAVVFIYMVLASQFASYVQPLLIMLAMPLSVIGAILALTAFGRPLDLTAFIGFIMLMGLVTKNSILLVDFANRQRARGLSADDAMRIAGPIRLRPILMTALSLILAMIPVALGLGSGGEFRSSMAIAIMGGMLTSTFLTLLFVPVAYAVVVGNLDRLGQWFAARRARKEASHRAAAQMTAAQSAAAKGAAADSPSNPDSSAAQTAGD